MLAVMDAAQALRDLTDISPQLRYVAVVAADGSVTASNLKDEAAAKRLADGARQLVEAADEIAR